MLIEFVMKSRDTQAYFLHTSIKPSPRSGNRSFTLVISDSNSIPDTRRAQAPKSS